MKPDRKVKKYTAALMSVAKRTDTIDSVHRSMQTISHLLRRDPTFRSFFQTRRIPVDKKRSILERVLGDAVHPMASEFFGILSACREQHLFHQTSRSFDLLRRQELNLLPVTATFPERWPDEDNERFEAALSKITQRRVEFESTVDSEIIGGVKLRVGNDFVDGSIKGNLERLKKRLISS